jgi:hypothetical protein
LPGGIAAVVGALLDSTGQGASPTLKFPIRNSERSIQFFTDTFLKGIKKSGNGMDGYAGA